MRRFPHVLLVVTLAMGLWKTTSPDLVASRVAYHKVVDFIQRVALEGSKREGSFLAKTGGFFSANALALVGVPVLSSTMLLNHSFVDKMGTGWVAVYSDGRLNAQLNGFGTYKVTEGCVSSCRQGIQLLGPQSHDMRGFFNLQKGYGCSPLVIPLLVGFLQEHGQRFFRIAVVASGVPLKVSQLVARAAGFRQIRFFGEEREARLWLDH